MFGGASPIELEEGAVVDGDGGVQKMNQIYVTELVA